MTAFDALLASIGAGEETVEPWGETLVVRPLEREAVTRAGLYVPDAARVETGRGLVVAVGPGMKPETPGGQTVVPGDRIFFEESQATEMEIGGEKLLSIPGYAIYGIIRSGA